MNHHEIDADPTKLGPKFSRMSWPYAWLLASRKAHGVEAPQKRYVVFFGNDFYGTSDINREKFTERTNQCLDYLRTHYAEYTLLYRPHPEERREMEKLDLTSFEIQRDGRISEEFVLDNLKTIEATFSFCSTSSIASFNMGVPSYVFYKCFADIFGGTNKIFVDNYLRGLPGIFFVDSLETPPSPQNTQVAQNSLQVPQWLENALTEHKGPIWFTIQEDRYILVAESLVTMIRRFWPERKMHIIVSKHHRWSEDQMKRLEAQFDSVTAFGRVFYSLRPNKILRALYTAIQVRRIAIDEDSIIIGIAHHDFIENCVVSYNRSCFKVAVLPESVWRLNFKTEHLGFDTSTFVFDKAGIFYNMFFEPLLGLSRTMFIRYRKGSKGSTYFIRLQKPIEETYDNVVLISNSPLAK